MFPEERQQRGAIAAPGETARGAMTFHTTIRKQLRRRFALIEILGIGRDADERLNDAEDKQRSPQPWLQHEPR